MNRVYERTSIFEWGIICEFDSIRNEQHQTSGNFSMGMTVCNDNALVHKHVLIVTHIQKVEGPVLVLFSVHRMAWDISLNEGFFCYAIRCSSSAFASFSLLFYLVGNWFSHNRIQWKYRQHWLYAKKGHTMHGDRECERHRRTHKTLIENGIFQFVKRKLSKTSVNKSLGFIQIDYLHTRVRLVSEYCTAIKWFTTE